MSDSAVLSRLNIFKKLIVGLFLSIGLYITLLKEENLHVLLYAVVLYIVINFVFIRRRQRSQQYFIHAIGLLFCYIVLQIVLRISPFLQVLEFQLTHSTWIKSHPTQLLNQEVVLHRTKGSPVYSYVKIDYQYQYQQRIYTASQSDIARQYQILWSEKASALKALSMNKFKNGYQTRQDTLFINPASPEQTVYFYSRQYFDFRGSWLAVLLYFSQSLLVAGLFYIAVFLVKVLLIDKLNFQQYSKTKKIVLITLFIVMGWCILMFVWIFLMYITA